MESIDNNNNATQKRTNNNIQSEDTNSKAVKKSKTKANGEKRDKNNMYYKLTSPWIETEYTFMIQGLNKRNVQIQHLAKVLGYKTTQNFIYFMQYLDNVPVTVISSAKKGKFELGHLKYVLERVGWTPKEVEEGLAMLTYDKGSKEKIGIDHPNEPNLDLPPAWLNKKNTTTPITTTTSPTSSIVPKGDSNKSNSNSGSNSSSKADSTEGGGGGATKKRQIVVAASPKKVVQIEESYNDDFLNFIIKHGGPKGYEAWLSTREGIAHRNWKIANAVAAREEQAKRDALFDIDNAILEHLYTSLKAEVEARILTDAYIQQLEQEEALAYEEEKKKIAANARSINKRI